MIQADLAIPFDRPRTLSVRDHPEMISIRQEIWSMIEREVRQDLRILA
jgi:hypothetical protein